MPYPEQESPFTCVPPIMPLMLKVPEGRNLHVESVFSHQQGQCSPPEIHHGLSTELHTIYVVFYLFFVTVCKCVLRRWCRRWACQAHVHGGDVQRSGAHGTPLCYVLRPMVSEQLMLVTKFFKTTLNEWTGNNICLSSTYTENRKQWLLRVRLELGIKLANKS